MGIRTFSANYRKPIHAIYGFVRLADEIVDSFHEFNKQLLLNRYKEDTFSAISEGISLNPVLHSFQLTVNHYKIDTDLINRFLQSMEMDLEKKFFNKPQFDEYVLGSAEVIGLMCLKVFCFPDHSLYEELKPLAMRLGSAFQKINFLRDLKADYQILGRSYFPNIDLSSFNEANKMTVIQDIENDLLVSFKGINKLPREVKYGVLLSYQYYSRLLNKIKHTPAQQIIKQRIRVTNAIKLWVFLIIIFRKYFQI
jgi:phytoene/squalene synthetase